MAAIIITAMRHRGAEVGTTDLLRHGQFNGNHYVVQKSPER
jgi:hypothetical protein